MNRSPARREKVWKRFGSSAKSVRMCTSRKDWKCCVSAVHAGDEVSLDIASGSQRGRLGRKPAGEHRLERNERAGEAVDALVQLVSRHPVGRVHAAEDGLVHGNAGDREAPRRLRVELPLELSLGGRELGEQLGADGEQVAAGGLTDLAPVA